MSDLSHPKPQALVLLSGGLDSAVALAKAREAYEVALVLTINYGQRALKKELMATAALADHYHLPHRVVALPWMAEILPQALQANGSNNPDVDVMAVHTVWVPNRNGLFLNLAAALAEAHHCQVVVFGANAEEAVDFPDNTQAYREALNQALAYSTLNQVRVETPVGDLTKSDIVELGLALNVPLHLIWSCYESGDRHCGQCASCIRLKAALFTDQKTWRVDLPFAH